MARAATTADAFNAVAEPRRREILDLLLEGERPVGDLAERMRLAQPHVSRHLRVLREVGLVTARDEGRRRLYRLDPRPLQPIGAWLARYERMWDARLDAMADVISELQKEEDDDGSH